MLVFRRLNVLNAFLRYTKMKKRCSMMDHESSLVHNLMHKASGTVACRTFNTLPNFQLDEKIRKYLNYVTTKYKQGVLHKDSELAALSKSHDFQKILTKRIEILENISALEELATSDKEVKALQKEEALGYEAELDAIDCQLIEVILDNIDSEIYERVVFEILPGVGGLEAMIFANDLLNMYMRYLNYLGCNFELLECEKPQPNSLKYVYILIEDSRVYHKLKYEGGIHRVQRVPQTERQGRVHTSTATVVVSPAPSEVQISISDSDLKIDTMKSSSAGGQHVNTTESAVRVTHLPTGIAVSCQTQRSQIKNKEIALIKLRAMLFEQEQNKQDTSLSTLKKQQIGQRTRNEKIRTYNYPQDRVTDHRMSEWKISSLKMFMENPAPLEKLQDLFYKEWLKNAFQEITRKVDKLP